MRILVASALLLAAAAPAHAMGVYHHTDVVAWSADGKAVLLSTSTTSSGQVGRSTVLSIVTADASAQAFTFTDTLDGDVATEHVDRLQCTDTAMVFVHALAAHDFKGIAVDGQACATAERHVVMVGAEASRQTANAWIPAPARAKLTKRELLARDAAKVAAGDPGDSPASVATANGRLYIVIWGENGDASDGARATAVRPTKHGMAIVGGER